MNYETTADELTKRILKLIPGNLKILDMDNAWDLFRVDGFKCDDIAPSLGQAMWSLEKAKKLYTRLTKRRKMNLQEAFNKLFKISEQACDADLDLSEEELNNVMTDLWSVLRETKGFYTDELPKWLQEERAIK